MKKTIKKKRVVTADQISRMADRGEDVSKFFTNKGKMMSPVQRVNVDLTTEMLTELDEAARQMNVSRQAVIKSYVRQGLDQRYLAQKARQST
jgi:hypothetical protein